MNGRISTRAHRAKIQSLQALRQERLRRRERIQRDRWRKRLRRLIKAWHERRPAEAGGPSPTIIKRLANAAWEEIGAVLCAPPRKLVEPDRLDDSVGRAAWSATLNLYVVH